MSNHDRIVSGLVLVWVVMTAVCCAVVIVQFALAPASVLERCPQVDRAGRGVHR
jgi:hypothetical protein